MRNRIVVAGAVLVTVAACSSTAEVTAGPTPAATTSAPATSAPATTSAPTPARTPAVTRTPAPVTEDAPCPYAGAEVVAETVGQHIARTTVTRTRPHVGCAFYRPNGEKAADVAVSVLASAAAARARAVAFPGAGANPVESVADGGAVKVTADGAVLAVSKGAALVVVRINQTVSLEAVEIAKLVVAKL